MALFALKPILNPAEVRLQYTSRIEAVAYPSFEMHSRTPHLIITQDPENFEYFLRAKCVAHYVAEGRVSFGPYKGVQHPFKFQTTDPLKSEWRLSLGKYDDDRWYITGPPDVAAHTFLQKVGFPAARKNASAIAQGIESHFFSPSTEPITTEPTTARNAHWYQGLITAMKVLATDDYQRQLEKCLNGNPHQPINPQHYQYDCSKGLIFHEPELLEKVPLP